MTEQQQARFEGWAIVDVLGHQRYVGFVNTEAYGQAVLFRVDVPALVERERTTKAPEYVGGRYVPAGTVVKEGAVQGYTKLIGSGSIYCITPCTEKAALKAVEDLQRRPLMGLTLPEGHALAPAEVTDAQLDAIDDMYDRQDAEGESDDDDDATGDEQRSLDDLNAGNQVTGDSRERPGS